MINLLLKPFIQFIPENNRFERIWKLSQVDFKRRYYNDKLGMFWAFLNPLFKIFIYYIVFVYVLDRGQDNFVLFLFAGLLLFSSFSEATNKSLNVYKSKRYLFENIQFEKIDLFVSCVISVFIGLSFNLFIYLCFVVIFGIPLSITLFYLPFLLLNLFLLSTGVSLLLSTLQIYFKDIKHVWSIVLLAGFWSSAIFFPAEQILDFAPYLVFLNPLIGIIENLRIISIDGTSPNMYWMAVNYMTSFFILSIGYISFNKFSHKAIELL